MNDFTRLALDWYRQHLDEITPGGWADIIDTVSDIVETIDDALEQGATIDEVAEVLQLPAADIANLISR